MTYRLNDKQYEAVRRLPAPGRYEHLVKRAADTGQLWALRSDDGWVLAADDEGREIVPVWPHPRYAEACATGAWQGSTPAPIDVHDWLERWTPELVSSSRLVGIFQVDSQPGAAMDATVRRRPTGRVIPDGVGTRWGELPGSPHRGRPWPERPAGGEAANAMFVWPQGSASSTEG